MAVPQIVVDTNVLIAGLRSRRGASYKLLTQIGLNIFEINLSVPLLFEYESVTKRLIKDIPLTKDDIDDIGVLL